MTDLLTPSEVRGMVWQPPHIERLCLDYLTLWERNKELEATLIAAAMLTDEVREEFRDLRKDLEGRVLP